MPPTISIVTPTLNAAAFLPACLESVRAQGVAGLEHIVVDGGSSDMTAQIARAAANVRYIEQPGSNQTRAINYGFQLARGEILAWLNADDVYCPGALSLVVDSFTHNDAVDVVYGDCDVVAEDNRPLWRETPGPYDFERLLRRGNYIAQPSVFLHRRIFDQLGYLDESFECGMDYEFWLRIRDRQVEYVPHVLANFRWHRGSKTAVGQFVCWRELLRAARRHGGGWTPALALSFSRMLITLARQHAWRRLAGDRPA